MIVLDDELNFGGSAMVASHHEPVMAWPLHLQGMDFRVIGPAGSGKINGFNSQQPVVGVGFKNLGVGNHGKRINVPARRQGQCKN